MTMMMSRLALRGLVLGLAFGVSQAFAADAKQIADALVAATTASGKAEASYEDATADGDEVTITNFKMSGEGDTMTIPSIVVSGAAERDKGGFTADSMSLDGATLTTGQSQTITWETASVEDAVVPSAEEIKAKARISPFSKFSLANLSIEGGDLAAPVGVESIEATVAVEEDGTPKEFTSSVTGIKLPPELFDDPQQKAVLAALGYSGFVLGIEVDGAYETASDTLTVRSFVIDAADVGKIAFDGKFSGVSLSKLSDPSKAKDVQSTGKLENFKMRFENAGIVEKALDMQAKQTGSTREELVAQFSGALPLMLNMIGNQPFQDKVASAATAFLNEPKSITISASPSAPVAFDKILSAVSDAPQSLPDLLGADVKANN